MTRVSVGRSITMISSVRGARNLASREMSRFRIHVGGEFKLFSLDVGEVRIQSRRGKAIIAIAALSKDGTVSRQTLKSLLWSRSPKLDALAQIRNAIYRLRVQMADYEQKLMTVTALSLSLNLNSLELTMNIEQGQLSGIGLPPQHSDFLVGLDGIDPAFDNWLADARAGLFRSWTTQILHDTVQAKQLEISSSRSRRITTIGICPFRSIGSNLEDHVHLALAEEIATALSVHSRLAVISVNSVASCLASGNDPWSQLGLDFLMEGLLQSDGKSLIFTTRLVEAKSGVIAWTERLIFKLGELFYVQKHVASQLIARLETRLPNLEIARIDRHGPAQDKTYRLVLEAMTYMNRLDRSTFMEAGNLLRMAIAVEPDYGAPYAWLALWLIFFVGQGWAEHNDSAIAEAGRTAARAIDLDPEDARALTVAGHVQAYLFGDLTAATALHERALVANPSLTLAWHLSAMTCAYSGDLFEAQRRLEACCVLAPNDPNSWFADGARIIVLMLAGEYHTAIEIGRRVTKSHPTFTSAYKGYLAALGHAGNKSEAVLVYSKLMLLEPRFSLKNYQSTMRYIKVQHVETFLKGLALAGVK